MFIDEALDPFGTVADGDHFPGVLCPATIHLHPGLGDEMVCLRQAGEVGEVLRLGPLARVLDSPHHDAFHFSPDTFDEGHHRSIRAHLLQAVHDRGRWPRQALGERLRLRAFQSLCLCPGGFGDAADRVGGQLHPQHLGKNLPRLAEGNAG